MVTSCPLLRVVLGLRLETRISRYEQPIAKLQFSTIEDSASPSFHQYFKTCLLKMMIVCKNFSDAKFFRYDYANAID